MAFTASLKNKTSKISRVGFYAGILALCPLSLTISGSVQAESHSHEDNDLELGLKLETKFWTAVENQDVEKYSEKLSHIFQARSPTALYTREETINWLATVTLTSFTVTEETATRADNTLVVSYLFTATGTNISTSSTIVSVWKKQKGHWKLISRAFVTTV